MCGEAHREEGVCRLCVEVGWGGEERVSPIRRRYVYTCISLVYIKDTDIRGIYIDTHSVHIDIV